MYADQGDAVVPIRREYSRLWLAQTISLVGNSLFATTVLIWVATVIMKGSRWAVLSASVLLALEALTVALTAPLVGAVIDRHDKRRTMLCCDLIRAGIIGALTILALLPAGLMPTPVALLLIGLATTSAGVVSQAFNTARFILIQDFAPHDRRGRAAGHSQASTAMAYAVGPALAALLFAAGPPCALAVNAGLFLISFAALRPLRTARSHPAAHSGGGDSQRNLRREAAAGLRLLAANPALRAILTAMMLLMLGGAALESLMLFFVRENLHAPASWYGLCVAASSVGTLSGAPLAGRLGDRIGHAKVFWVGLLAFGVLFEALALQRDPCVGMILVGAAGFAIAFPACSMLPLVMGTAAPEYQGRALSMVTSAIGFVTIAATVLSGVVASVLGPSFRVEIAGFTLHRYDTIYLACGLTVLAAGLYARLAVTRRVERVSPTPTDDPEVAGAGP
jgi:MFS family permease